jgi:hypothetical protein
VSGPAGARVGGVALGCGLLALVDLAVLGLALMGAAVLGGPSGDVGLVLYAAVPLALMFPLIQPVLSAVTALGLVILDRRPMAIGVVATGAVTTIGSAIRIVFLMFGI